MYERLRKLYRAGKIGETELQNAVEIGWITQAQMDLIISENQD